MTSKFQLISGHKDKIKKNKVDKKLFYIQKYYNLYLDYQYGLNRNVDKLKSVYYGIKYIASVLLILNMLH